MMQSYEPTTEMESTEQYRTRCGFNLEIKATLSNNDQEVCVDISDSELKKMGYMTADEVEELYVAVENARHRLKILAAAHATLTAQGQSEK